MLYATFRVMATFCGVMGLIIMISQSTFTFVILPIIIIIWGLFSFFEPNDKEYLRRNGIIEDEYLSFFSDDGYYNNTQYDTYNPRTTQHTTSYIGGKYSQYNEISKKCKRNFKISIGEEKS
jgi:hypothetical protein